MDYNVAFIQNTIGNWVRYIGFYISMANTNVHYLIEKFADAETKISLSFVLVSVPGSKTYVINFCHQNDWYSWWRRLHQR